jgi:hypothetical protein
MMEKTRIIYDLSLFTFSMVDNDVKHGSDTCV